MVGNTMDSEIEKLTRKIDLLEAELRDNKFAMNVLSSLSEATVAEVGAEYFQSLVKTVAYLLNVKYAFVCETLNDPPSHARTLAFWANNKFIDNMFCSLEGTPCKKTAFGEFVYYPKNIQGIFPNDELLVDLGAESYCGIPLKSANGDTLGHLAVMDVISMNKNPGELPVLPLFAKRAASELERIKANDALLKEKVRLMVTLKSIGEGVISTDDQGKITLMNEIAEEITEWKQEEAIGQYAGDILNFVQKDRPNQVIDTIEYVIKSGEILKLVPNTPNLISKSGKKRIVTIIASPIRDSSDNISGTVQVFNDVTKLEKLNNELIKMDKLEAIGVLAAGIAHDFNNLLTGVIGNLSLLQYIAGENDKSQKIFRNIEQSSIRAKKLAQKLMTFSKGGQPVKCIAKVDQIVMDSVNLSIMGSEFNCEFIFEENLLPIFVDEIQFHQVIQNLIVNSCQAMSGGGTITIKGECIDILKNEIADLKAGKYVIISITDSGKGISEGQLSKIFDPFFTTKENASGMGLSIAYSIVKNHEGCLTALSNMGEGTTFLLYLPVKESSSDSDGKVRKSFSSNQIRAKVLVMDDQQAILDFTAEALRLFECDVTTTSNGTLALKEFERSWKLQNNFDIVILDLIVPGFMGGKESLAKMVEIDPNITAIAMSGYCDDPIMKDYCNYGFTASIPKPFTMHVLEKTLRECLSLRSGPTNTD